MFTPGQSGAVRMEGAKSGRQGTKEKLVQSDSAAADKVASPLPRESPRPTCSQQQKVPTAGPCALVKAADSLE